MTDELKPCPFCGSTRVKAYQREDWWLVGCFDCGAESESDLGRSGAIAAWNTRPLEAKLLEACEAALNDFKGTLEDHVTSDPVAIAMHPTIKQLQAAINAAKEGTA